MMPNGKLCRPAVNKRQLVSALVMGYVHSNSKCTGGGSIDWHFLQFLTSALTDALGSTCLTKYNVHLILGWLLWWWMDLIRLKSCLLSDIAHTQYGGSTVFLMRSTHCCGTLVRPSTLLYSDLTRTASTDSSYSLTKLASTSSHHLISISLATFVCTLAFLVRVSVIHSCPQAESVWRCSLVAFHINAMFKQHQALPNLYATYPSPFTTSSHPPQQLHHVPVILWWPGNFHQPKRRVQDC